MTPKQFWVQLQKISPKHLAVDLVIILASLFTAGYLRVGPTDFRLYVGILQAYLPVIVLVRLACMTAFGCYSVMWRYISTIDASRLAKAISLSTAIIIAITFFLPPDMLRLPRSVYVIDALLVTIGLMGARLYRRLLYEGRANRETKDGKRTLIYGAGENGRLLAHRFKSDSSLDTNVVGFIDDDEKKADLIIQGFPVLGNRTALAHIIEKFNISQLIVAIPDMPGEVLRELVMATRPFNIKPRVVTCATDTAKSVVEIYREVELSDLLNRPKRSMDLSPVRNLVRGKRVLVTGAGGSIGSELARQIMALEPGRLLLLDHSEYNLYEIDKELRLSTHDTQRVVPLMIDLKDHLSLRTAMLEFAPEVIFHAAAYKHVHLVEANPHSSILNNVGGTKALLDLSREIGVETFLMVSTDKAVNPAGVMGATKRVCELLVTAMALETGRRYCSTRFGNVLGSSGSLIPLLKSQIQNGGPVTVTHPDMTRFFMLIPEAVSLVLTAATIARPGDINVLRMGEPVKILDIARSLISLMGKTEDEIPVVFTGLRPGEKMFEELYIRGDELKTEHPDILTLTNGDSTMAEDASEILRVRRLVDEMLDAAEAGSKEALFKLNDLVKSNYVAAADEHKDMGVLSYFVRTSSQQPH
ncbi:MAG: polysaccharide biosynthesis protein [Bdellovibrionaceae bacterium]|nr:polysaccharide biosynthesis protein [Pseudobdellovibrionaceae bacterium]